MTTTPPIKVGDLVIVTAPTKCGNSREDIGKLFRVGKITRGKRYVCKQCEKVEYSSTAWPEPFDDDREDGIDIPLLARLHPDTTLHDALSLALSLRELTK